MAAQPPRIRITHVVDPSLHAGIQFSEGNPARPEEGDIVGQVAGKIDRIAPFDAPVRRIDHKTQPYEKPRGAFQTSSPGGVGNDSTRPKTEMHPSLMLGLTIPAGRRYNDPETLQSRCFCSRSNFL